jgi:hypothetical protein
MRWVPQRDDRGCGLAVLAMLTGQPYEAVKLRIAADAGPSEHRGDWAAEGLTVRAMDRYLARAGFAIQRLYRNMDVPWPPAPWAPLHFAQVVNSGGMHFVAMDAAGTILDPLHEQPRSFEDWEMVANVAGVVPVARGGSGQGAGSALIRCKRCGVVAGRKGEVDPFGPWRESGCIGGGEHGPTETILVTTQHPSDGQEGEG